MTPETATPLADTLRRSAAAESPSDQPSAQTLIAEDPRLLELLDHTCDAMVLVDASGRVVACNAAAEASLDGVVAGLPMDRLWPDPAATAALLNEVLPRAVREGRWSGRLPTRWDGIDQSALHSVLGHHARGGRLVALTVIVAPPTRPETTTTLADVAGTALPLSDAIDLAVGAAEAVAAVHRHGLVHRSLRPSSFTLSATDHTVAVTGFGTARPLTPGVQAPRDASAALEEDLAYVSPEQTGRVNRSVNRRSDLYSLGVVLYELFCGVTPFTAEDPLEWVYAHVARVPPTLREHDPELPPAIDEIVMRLLAKDPEERYQSAAGLVADLERCREALASSGSIPSFGLGSRDVSDVFQVPQRLYGREAPLRSLNEAFARVVRTGQCELALVAGPAGIGKSVLVHGLREAVTRAEGVLVAGKFGQQERSVPYAPFARAIGELVQQSLAMAPGQLAAQQTRLRKAVGEHGGVITDLVPRAALLLGETAPPPPLPLHEAQPRAHRVIGDFLDVFTADRPLVIVLDDLQWADPATLQLVADLLSHRHPRRLLLLGTYRDDALVPSDPLTTLTLAPQLARTAVRLGPLGPEAIGRLLADTLGSPPEACAELADLVIEKTGGSPYYVLQFLHELHQNGLIDDHGAGGGWRWDSEQIAAAAVTDNVVDIMSGRLGALAPEALHTLSIAAFLGDPFDRETLAIAARHAERTVEADLWDAMRERLVLTQPGGYRFSHDRVQQVAYELVPARDRPALHLEIGRRLCAAMPLDELGERVFSIAGHVNAGRALVTDPAEQLRFAALNLQAGRRAMTAAAFRSAAEYLRIGMELLPPDAWEADHRLAFDLRLERARCEHLGGDVAAAEDLTDALLEHATTPDDIAAAYPLRVELFLARSEPGAATDAGLRGWQALGLSLEPEPSHERVDQAAQVVWNLLGDRPIESLLDLPLTTEPNILASTAIIGPLLTSAFLAERHDLAILLMVENTRLSLIHGNTPASPLLHALFGTTIGARFGEFQLGRRLGRAAHARVMALDALPLEAQTSVYVGNASSWTDPYAECQPFLRTGFESGKRAGDLAHAGFSAFHSLVMRYAGGEPLGDIVRESEPLLAFACDMKLPENRDALLMVVRCAESLRGGTNAIGTFGSDDFDEDAYLERMWSSRPPFYHAILALHQASVAVFGRRIAGGLEAAERFDRVRGALAWHPLLLEAESWTALARAAAWNDAAPEDRPALREHIAKSGAQLAEWAQHGPANVLSRAELITAELARIDGRTDEAAAAYERAIAAAQRYGMVHHEALARELTGRFYLDRGLTSVGQACLQEARDRYERWGAAAKTDQLGHEFPGLLGRSGAESRAPELDMLAVVRGSQAISGELDLEQLPSTLLRIAVAAAGAQVGRLFQVSGDRAEVLAVAEVEHETVHVTLPAGDPGGSDATPQTVVDYVMRTGERVLLEDARVDPVFSADPAIARHGIRSLLGQPIVRHGSVVGILLLEHRLVTGAFTTQRLTAVEVLAAQAAISVETARLYQDVREENRVRRRTEAELRASEEQFRSLVESAPDAILITDAAGHVVLVNSRAEQLFSHPRDSLIGLAGEQLVPEIDWTGGAAARDVHGSLEVERRGLAADGTTFPVEVTLSPLDRPEGAWTIGMVRDVTERKRLEHELEQAADHDALTGLLNRGSLERELTAAIANVERSRSVAVLLVLDLDRIRDINDSLGPQVGDQLIRGVADAISERVRPTDTLARLDGDEFALILSRTDLSGARALADELLALVRAFTLDSGGTLVRTTASVGIAPITAGAATAQSLLSAADIALNQAKEDGRDRAATYTPDSHRRAAERHTWSERIRHALEHDEFTLHAQPILDLRTGEATHSELLIRMRDNGQLIAPGEFLPTAERTGSILSIDRWVIREAVRLSAQGHPGLLELNLSARSLADLGLPDYIQQEVGRAGADPETLIFEITETAAIANLQSAAALAERLTTLGCRFALDDFGVGFGSFYYLKRLPLHYIKIDGDFIQSLTRSPTDQHVTKAIVDVAQGMGLKTIAEFVEDAETLELLRSYGVDYAQGFHIGRPAQVREPRGA